MGEEEEVGVLGAFFCCGELLSVLLLLRVLEFVEGVGEVVCGGGGWVRFVVREVGSVGVIAPYMALTLGVDGSLTSGKLFSFRALFSSV